MGVVQCKVNTQAYQVLRGAATENACMKAVLADLAFLTMI
jgi:hypothetical protein